MRIGQQFKFVRDKDMPRLEAERIAQACDDVVSKRNCYKSLLYLSRARTDDVGCLFEASRHQQAQIRWQRLWVLISAFSRLSRAPRGAGEIHENIKSDFPALHMLTKFDPTSNVAAERFFDRMHDYLLPEVLSLLIKHRLDAKRAPLLAAIVARIQPEHEEVYLALEKMKEEEQIIEAVMNLLPDEPEHLGKHQISTSAIREKLLALKKEDAPPEEQ